MWDTRGYLHIARIFGSMMGNGMRLAEITGPLGNNEVPGSGMAIKVSAHARTCGTVSSFPG